MIPWLKPVGRLFGLHDHGDGEIGAGSRGEFQMGVESLVAGQIVREPAKVVARRNILDQLAVQRSLNNRMGTNGGISGPRSLDEIIDLAGSNLEGRRAQRSTG